MTHSAAKVEVRPIVLEDLDAIFLIDHKIRRAGKAVTYANLTTERIFTINRHVGRLAKPTSYVDLITGDVSQLFQYSFVAEVDGHVRGFILGQVSPVGKAENQVGIILILGVHPDYQRRGIGSALVNTICDKYRSEGIKRVCIYLDQRDKELLSFAEHVGLGVGHLIQYCKAL